MVTLESNINSPTDQGPSSPYHPSRSYQRHDRPVQPLHSYRHQSSRQEQELSSACLWSFELSWLSPVYVLRV